MTVVSSRCWRVAVSLACWGVSWLGAPSAAGADVQELARGAQFGGGVVLDGPRVTVGRAAQGRSKPRTEVRVLGAGGVPQLPDLVPSDDAVEHLQLAGGSGGLSAAEWRDNWTSILRSGPADGPFQVVQTCRGRRAFGAPYYDFGPPPPATSGSTVAWLACGRGDRVLLLDRGAREILVPGGRVRSLALAGRTLAIGILKRGRQQAEVVLRDLDGIAPDRRIRLAPPARDVALAGQPDGTVAVARLKPGWKGVCPTTTLHTVDAGAEVARRLALQGCGRQLAVGGGRIVVSRPAPRRPGPRVSEAELVVMPLSGGRPVVLDHGDSSSLPAGFAIDDQRVVWIHRGCASEAILSAPVDALPSDQRPGCTATVEKATLTRKGRLAVQVRCPLGCSDALVMAYVPDHRMPGRSVSIGDRGGERRIELDLPRAEVVRLRRQRRPRVLFFLDLGGVPLDARFRSEQVRKLRVVGRSTP